MEALNATALKPVCLLPEKTSKPRKKISAPSIPRHKSPTNFQKTLSRVLHGSTLALISPFLTPKSGIALTYEEALQQSVTNVSGGEFDGDGVSLDGILTFAGENPLLIGGCFAVLAVPLIVSRFFGDSKPFGVESAKIVYAKLGEDPSSQLLDIRSLKDSREVGSPDLKGLKKKPVSTVYNGEDKPGFLKKLALKFKEPENTTLFILDKFDGNSKLVAELVTANGFKAAYAIKDGAEGSRGWLKSNLPWMTPKKSFDFGELGEAIAGALPDGSEALVSALGLAATTGLGLLAFAEMETVLQVLGSAAIIQVISKKLLFEEDRKKTLKEVDDLLNKQLAAKELVSDLKQIGTALLPTPVTSKALPAPAVSESTPPKAESVTAFVATEEKVESPAEINSPPQTEAKAEPQGGVKRPLSPFTMYPDLKPPSSPRPSQPQTTVTKVEAIAEPVPEPVAEPVPEPGAEPVPEPVAEPAPEINSVPQPGAAVESSNGAVRALSPFPLYPDLKPPSSPCPTQP